jgi:diacylglycerol kinase family enzyme
MLLVQKNFTSKNIEIHKTKNVAITAHKKSYFQVDGEYRGKFNNIEAAIVPSALKILLPAPQQTQQKQ